MEEDGNAKCWRPLKDPAWGRSRGRGMVEKGVHVTLYHLYRTKEWNGLIMLQLLTTNPQITDFNPVVSKSILLDYFMLFHNSFTFRDVDDGERPPFKIEGLLELALDLLGD